jgi:hypothetical protein
MHTLFMSNFTLLLCSLRCTLDLSVGYTRSPAGYNASVGVPRSGSITGCMVWGTGSPVHRSAATPYAAYNLCTSVSSQFWTRQTTTYTKLPRVDECVHRLHRAGAVQAALPWCTPGCSSAAYTGCLCFCLVYTHITARRLPVHHVQHKAEPCTVRDSSAAVYADGFLLSLDDRLLMTFVSSPSLPPWHRLLTTSSSCHLTTTMRWFDAAHVPNALANRLPFPSMMSLRVPTTLFGSLAPNSSRTTFVCRMRTTG